MGLTKCMKTLVKTSCAMATPTKHMFGSAFGSKNNIFTCNWGHVQNEINEIRVFVNSNHACGVNFVCLAQLQGQESYIQQNITALESRIKAILDNRFIFYVLCYFMSYLQYLLSHISNLLTCCFSWDDIIQEQKKRVAVWAETALYVSITWGVGEHRMTKLVKCLTPSTSKVLFNLL